MGIGRKVERRPKTPVVLEDLMGRLGNCRTDDAASQEVGVAQRKQTQINMETRMTIKENQREYAALEKENGGE